MRKPIEPTSIRILFGKNVRRERRSREISQEELAFRANISRTYVSEVERGLRNISIDNMEDLSIALGVPLGDLLKSPPDVGKEAQ